MSGYQRGDIVSVDFPFTDGTASKVRPALVISNSTIEDTGNIIIAMITSRQGRYAPVVELTENLLSHPLPKQSLVRCHRLYTIDNTLVRARYSRLSPEGLKMVFDQVVQIIG